LNKGESLLALRRDLCYAHEGKVRHRDHQDQTEQALCLTVVTNAIVAWTTEYLALAVDERRERRLPRHLLFRGGKGAGATRRRLPAAAAGEVKSILGLFKAVQGSSAPIADYAPGAVNAQGREMECSVANERPKLPVQTLFG
jgi:hypothetical protein